VDERGHTIVAAEHTHAPGGQPADDDISLQPYVDTLRRYRRPIVALTLLVGVLFILAAVGVVVLSPSEHVASVSFRLLFEGAAQNKYPNDSPFSPVEIVAAPVAAEVYRANDLQRFGTFEDFKDSLFVQQANPELDLLGFEYEARLADSKLSTPDRAKIEEDFRRRRESLVDPTFAISLRRSERFRVLPRELTQKILSDTLTTWAQQAEKTKGVMKYQVPILSSRVFSRDTLENNDYLVAADQLRAGALRILATIAALEKVPGALTVRTQKDGVTLPEIRARLEDVMRFELEPLLGIIRSEGITKNARLVSLYASNMVFQLQLDKQEIQSRAQALQTSLRDYVAPTSTVTMSEARGSGSRSGGGLDTPGLMPQLSESFLDRLEKMSALTQKGEMEYRRKLTDQVIQETRQVATVEKELAYYEALLKNVEGIGNRSVGNPELVSLIKARSLNAFEGIEKATDQLSVLYQEISAQNLNPAARLFEFTGPFSDHTSTSRPIGRMALMLLFVMFATLIVVSAACLFYEMVMRKRLSTTAPASQV
jgi:hypothetical protein